MKKTNTRIAPDLNKTYTVREILELLAIPCCHTSGMHDPEHFRERKYVCNSQAEDALIRFCKALGINPVTHSDETCYWCHSNENAAKSRKGEGLPLIPANDELVTKLDRERSHRKPTTETMEQVSIVLRSKTNRGKFDALNTSFRRQWRAFIKEPQYPSKAEPEWAFVREVETALHQSPRTFGL